MLPALWVFLTEERPSLWLLDGGAVGSLVILQLIFSEFELMSIEPC